MSTKHSNTAIEILETRTVPAAVFTFTDIDGDLVKLSTSKGSNADLAAAVTVVGGQLRSLDLTAAVFQDTDLTAVVTRKGAAGDGIVNIGHINATDRDLGVVIVSGDLGAIDCGDATVSTMALKSLTVRSLGLLGKATQGGVGDLESVVQGGLGKLTVRKDIVGANLYVNGAEYGDIGSVYVGGSILGGSQANAGQIQTTDSIGPVTIVGDLVGGTGTFSGALYAGGKIASVTIGGSVVGGTQFSAGSIIGGEIGAVKIAGDLVGGSNAYTGSIRGGKLLSINIAGSMLGGSGDGSASIVSQTDIGKVSVGENVKGLGENSGRISAVDEITSVWIGGSLLGGAGDGSGAIVNGGTLGSVQILHDVKGGAGDNSGQIDSGGNVGAVTIGGSLIGGKGNQGALVGTVFHCGQIFAGGTLGPVKIGGNMQGGEGSDTGSVYSVSKIVGVTVGGSLLGGKGGYAGAITTDVGGIIGSIVIAHDLRGGEGYGDGTIGMNSKVGSVTIGGSLIGGSSEHSGMIGHYQASTAVVKIGHDLVGGSGESSGVVYASDVTIGGSLIGGTNDATGAIYCYGTDLKSVRIGHDFLGGSLPGQSDGFGQSGLIHGEFGIGAITIGGSIISGTDGSAGVDEALDSNASIYAGRAIGTLTVRGDILGNVTPAGDTRVVISALGQEPSGGATSDVAIGKISVGGRVEWTNILAGYDLFLKGKNADAQIGSVTVGGDWIASNIVAGAVNLGADGTPGGTGANADNVNFGNSQDRQIIEPGELTNVKSKIGSIAIGGQVFGTSEAFRSDDKFSFVAEEIGGLKVGGRTFTLTAGAANDGAPVNWRGDTIGNDSTFHEIGSPIKSTVTATDSAKLVNAKTVTYLDKDGDKVTVTFSKNVLTVSNVNQVFHFDTGRVDDDLSALQQLHYLDLRALQSNGLGVTFTVVRGATGDGLVHVGAIESTGYDVGTVTLPGDLGRIDAGDANLQTKGLAALNVRTFGRLGLDSQGPTMVGFTPSLTSDIAGDLGALAVRQDMVEVALNVNGSIGPVKIGGSLIGGAEASSGGIQAGGRIGTIQIGHHLQGGFGAGSGAISSDVGIGATKIGGSVLGAGGMTSGSIFGGITGSLQVGHNVRGGTNSNSAILEVENGASVTIGGSLIGGRGANSARITSDSMIGPIKIGHNILGGDESTARIEAKNIGNTTIGGSIIGGYGFYSGSLVSTGKMGTVAIAHDVQGGSTEAGRISATGNLAGVIIGGSLLGGTGGRSGSVESGADLGYVRVGGDQQGGEGGSSGMILATGKLDRVIVLGSLIGGSNLTSGTIISGVKMGSVTIEKNLLGGEDTSSGYLYAAGDLGLLTVGGSLVTGAKSKTGCIEVLGQTGTVRIGGDVIGGDRSGTGSIYLQGKVAQFQMDGSLVGGSNSNSGQILVGEMGTGKIGRNLLGGSIAGNQTVLSQTGYLESKGHIGSLTVGGSLFAGWDTSIGGGLTKNASIRSDRDIASIVVKGSLHGHATLDGISAVVISARGNPTPTGETNVAIGSLRVGGSVERANIFGGYTVDLATGPAIAQIGSIIAGRDWSASNVVVGVQNLGADDLAGGTGANADNVNFGDAHDTFIGLGNIANRIASITVGGVVTGTEASGDHFGFGSVNIGSFKSLNYTAPLTPATNVIQLSPATGDVTVREQ